MTGLIIFAAYSLVLSSIFYYLKLPYNRQWWLKVTTEEPQCIYYFGPFENRREAKEHLVGYKADLEAEQARITQVQLNQALPPAQLTLCLEEA